MNINTSTGTVSFHMPVYVSELRAFLKARGYKKLYNLTLGQLRKIYIKERLRNAK